jgi:hypothetical protein
VSALGRRPSHDNLAAWVVNVHAAFINQYILAGRGIAQGALGGDGHKIADLHVGVGITQRSVNSKGLPGGQSGFGWNQGAVINGDGSRGSASRQADQQAEKHCGQGISSGQPHPHGATPPALFHQDKTVSGTNQGRLG